MIAGKAAKFDMHAASQRPEFREPAVRGAITVAVPTIVGARADILTVNHAVAIIIGIRV